MILTLLGYNTLRADAVIEGKRQHAIEQVKRLYFF